MLENARNIQVLESFTVQNQYGANFKTVVLRFDDFNSNYETVTIGFTDYFPTDEWVAKWQECQQKYEGIVLRKEEWHFFEALRKLKEMGIDPFAR
jgi:hypothetical protein